MADTDILLSVDLNTVDAERTAEQLQKEIQGIFNSRQGQQSSSLTSLELQMKKMYDKASALREQMQSIADTQVATTEYEEASNQLQKYEGIYESLIEKMSQFEDAGGDISSTKYQQWVRQFEQVETQLGTIHQKMEQMRNDGTAFISGRETAEYQRLQQELDGVNDRLKQQIVRYREMSGKSVPQVTKQVQQLGKATNQVHKVTKSIGRTFGKIAMLFLGFRGVYALFMKIRSMILEGFKNLQESGVGRLKKQMNDLTNASTTLKNALAGAFEPIVTTIIPYIQRLVEWLTVAIDKLAQFIAAMKGQTTYIKAIKQVGDASAKANKQLSKLDNLNVLNSQGNGAAGMFEEAQVADEMINKVAELKQKIKELYDWLNEWIFYPVRDFINWFTQPIRDNIDKIKLALDNLSTFINNRITWIKQKIQGLLEEVKQIYYTYIKPTLDEIVGYISYFFGKILDFWNKHYEDIEWVAQQIQAIYDESFALLVSKAMQISGLVFKIVGKIFTFLNPQLDNLFHNLDLLWDKYFPNVKTVLTVTRIGIKMVSDVIQACLDVTIELLEEVADGFPKMGEYVNDFKNTFTAAFDAMLDKVRPVVQAITDLLTGLQSIAEWFAGSSGSATWTVLEKLANSNGFSLNTIYTGGSAQTNLKYKRGYASGGVIPPYASEHLVKVGDNKHETEVISPLSTMQEAMIGALQAVGLTGGSQEIVLNLDGREFMRAMVRQNNEYKKSHGGMSAMA